MFGHNEKCYSSAITEKYRNCEKMLDNTSAVTFDQVLAVNNGELTIGCPTVEGATVSATVEKVGKGKKVIVYKYKRKSGYHKKNGHRQLYTQVKIEKINA